MEFFVYSRRMIEAAKPHDVPHIIISRVRAATAEWSGYAAACATAMPPIAATEADASRVGAPPHRGTFITLGFGASFAQ
jgi:hypothetical protein